MYKLPAFFVVSVFTVVLIAGCGGGDSGSNPGDAPDAFRSVAIPAREHGYANFESVVIDSQAEMDSFLAKTALETSWNEKELFVRALEEADVNFEDEALVLIRNTEGSGSIRVSLDAPRFQSPKVTATIRRVVPQGGSADMAYYAFALAVNKSEVDEVNVAVDDREAIRLPIPD